MGISANSRLETKPIPPCILNLSVLGSIILISNTEAERPPKRVGIPPLYNSKSRIASEAKTENNPNIWVGLKIGVSSI